MLAITAVIVLQKEISKIRWKSTSTGDRCWTLSYDISYDNWNHTRYACATKVKATTGGEKACLSLRGGKGEDDCEHGLSNDIRTWHFSRLCLLTTIVSVGYCSEHRWGWKSLFRIPVATRESATIVACKSYNVSLHCPGCTLLSEPASHKCSIYKFYCDLTIYHTDAAYLRPLADDKSQWSRQSPPIAVQ